MNTKNHTNWLTRLALLVFVGFSGWWVYLHTVGTPSDSTLELFSGTYGVMALLGAITGFIVSKDWGGRQSYIGKAIIFFSLGLLAQEFGQISYSLYTLILNKEIPYPSIGDIGYFGSIPLYALGVWQLGKAVGASFTLQSYGKKLLALVLPLGLLIASYAVFLREYEIDTTQKLTVLLDFGYPLGQAFYLSLAILVYLLSRKYLGGIMRPVILFLLFALTVQYFADFMFLYQNNKETWTTAGSNDYVYLLAYFIMTIALLRFKTIAAKIKE